MEYGKHLFLENPLSDCLHWSPLLEIWNLALVRWVLIKFEWRGWWVPQSTVMSKQALEMEGTSEHIHLHFLSSLIHSPWMNGLSWTPRDGCPERPGPARLLVFRVTAWKGGKGQEITGSPMMLPRETRWSSVEDGLFRELALKNIVGNGPPWTIQFITFKGWERPRILQVFEILSTVSPLRMNLQVTRFQREERVFCQHQTWVRLQLALHLRQLTTLQLYHLLPPLHALVNNSTYLFIPRQPLCASYCTVLLYFPRYCTVRFKMFYFVFVFLCIIVWEVS